ncbi:UNVERIFIED_CONTAM: hypothetical protein FKN15_077560 [Acipenser sinensis]
MKGGGVTIPEVIALIRFTNVPKDQPASSRSDRLGQALLYRILYPFLHITEVTLKVHVSDASTHQPIAGATIEIFINQTSLTSETSGADGNAFIKFNYRLGTQLIVMATKQGYVPNSVPWRPTRLPVFSSLSLELLPERSATLMVYEDIVQIVSGFQATKKHM